MIRKIIKIDERKCDGCGLCAKACHEGAIAIIHGKARLIRDDYCDGLGDCLPACPTGAISFEEREADAYDEKAVMANQASAGNACPGSMAKTIRFEEHEVRLRSENETAEPRKTSAGDACTGSMARAIPLDKNNSDVRHEHTAVESVSALRQWPVQIKLVPINAPYFNDAHLLIAADCAAYAYANFHAEFMRGKVTLIGCPKLDDVDYAEKLTEIIRQNDIKSVTVVRMEVPCCGGIELAVVTGLKRSGKFIPWQIVTFSTDGRILE